MRLLEGDKNIEALPVNYPCPLNRQTTGITSALSAARQLLLANALSGATLRDHVVTCIFNLAEEITLKVAIHEKQDYNLMDRRIDSILTSKFWGIPVMLLLLGLVFWLTIKGANYPSQLLARSLFWGEEHLTRLFAYAGWPQWLHGLIVSGCIAP